MLPASGLVPHAKDPVSEAKSISQICRAVWEPVWPMWKVVNGYDADEDMPSRGCCIPTSFALAFILEATVPGVRWKARGGRPTLKTPLGGYAAEEEKAFPHLWVEGRNKGRVIVADITCDQFGGPEIFVQEGPSPHHRPNIPENLLAKYLENERETVHTWMMLVAKYG